MPIDNAVVNLPERIAADVYPLGGVLTCPVCGYKQEMSAKDAAHYLAHGWPRHCGRGMHVEANRFEREAIHG